MTRRARLPKITECVQKKKQSSRISAGKLAWAVYPFVVVATLALAHIYLQFGSTDMVIQQGKFQEKQRELMREQGTMNRRIEQLCNAENLKDLASRELHLREPRMDEQVVAKVSGVRIAEYSVPVSTAAPRNERVGQTWQQALLSLVDGRNANATSMAMK